VKINIINKNSADVRVTAVRARQAPKIIKMNIIEKRRISEAPYSEVLLYLRASSIFSDWQMYTPHFYIIPDSLRGKEMTAKWIFMVRSHAEVLLYITVSRMTKGPSSISGSSGQI
jgi:hypothetical protein